MTVLSETPQPELDYLTAAEAAAIIRIKPWAITKKCRTGEIPAIKPAKAWLIKPADFAAYLERHRNSPVEEGAA